MKNIIEYNHEDFIRFDVYYSHFLFVCRLLQSKDQFANGILAKNQISIDQEIMNAPKKKMNMENHHVTRFVTKTEIGVVDPFHHLQVILITFVNHIF